MLQDSAHRGGSGIWAVLCLSHPYEHPTYGLLTAALWLPSDHTVKGPRLWEGSRNT